MGKKRASKRVSGDAGGGGSQSKQSRLGQKGGNAKAALKSSSAGPLLASAVTSPDPAENSTTKSFGELNLSTPEDLLASLLGPATSLATFFSELWEKKPLVVHRGGGWASASYYGLGFTRDALLRLLAERRVEFEQDINVCRYVESKRENLNGTGRATAAKIKNLFDQKKATLQFHQPQRFQDEFWQICELLESYFRSLVGANIYMTPGGSQGLAPHYDDVEVLILQLEGRKHWRLYAPPMELPRDYSRDLSPEDIGQPTHDFILETGDFLYFPRGTVHQADTPEGCPYSTHVTISTYQRSSYGDVLELALPSILNSAIHNSLDFRKGLPTDFLTKSTTECASTFEHLLGQLSNHIGDHLQQAANQMMCDFVANRLPPYRCGHLEAGPVGPVPTDKCKVRLTFPRHTFVALATEDDGGDYSDEGEEEEEEDENEDEEDSVEDTSNGNVFDKDGREPSCFVVVRHSVMNSRTDHMMSTSRKEPKGLRFPVSHHQALQQLKEATDWLDSSKLDLPRGDVRNLLVSLWAEGLLEIAKE